ncbi:unnamed protein product, partial [Polarella glacialis]
AAQLVQGLWIPAEVSSLSTLELASLGFFPDCAALQAVAVVVVQRRKGYPQEVRHSLVEHGPRRHHPSHPSNANIVGHGWQTRHFHVVGLLG